jgi:predicted DNA-binding protein
MRSQIEKRTNINLTGKEKESLEILSKMPRFKGWTKSDLMRQAINVYAREMEELFPETRDDGEEPELITEEDELPF